MLLGCAALPGTAIGALNLWLVYGAGEGVPVSWLQAHATAQIGAFAIPLALLLGPHGARLARRLVAWALLVAAAAAAWAALDLSLPPGVFGPLWHLGLFGVALPLALGRADEKGTALGGPTVWMYYLGVLLTASGLAMPGSGTGHALVEAGRGLFAFALVLAALAWRPRVRSAALWVAAASIATVANAFRELAGGPVSHAGVSDAVRHVFTIGGVLLPLAALASPRAARAVAVLASFAAGLRLSVIFVGYGPAVLGSASRVLVVVSGIFGVAAVGLALACVGATSIDTPGDR